MFLCPLAFLAAGMGLLLWLEGVRLRVPASPPEGADQALAPASRPPEPQSELWPELWIDPADGKAQRLPSWADPRWAERLEAVLGETIPFRLDDSSGLDRTARAMRSLSFVRDVERCVADPVRGLLVVLALRRPAACLASGGNYLLVDEEGVVLDGEWSTPPRLGPFPLPVLGPLQDPLLQAARPGDWLVESEHLAALEVVRSLASHVGPGERARLGRVVIDAREAAEASVERPGIRLELEGGRLALFGRAPDSQEPGELAAKHKWASLLRALDRFESDPVGADWRLVDLRWDRPELALWQVPEAARPAPGHRVASSTVAAAASAAEGHGPPRRRERIVR